MAVRITKSAVNIREKLAELERPVGITGAALMKTETPQEAFSLIGARNRNVIINGAMVVNQRGFTGSSGATANGAYTTDRFFIEHSQDGAVSAGQTTMNSTVGGNAYADGFNSALHYRVTTADASLSANQYALIAQPIEGFNVQGFKKGTANAQQFTLSFWVRSSLTGTYIAELRDNDNTRFVSKSYTIDTANTWEKKTLTYPADTTGVLDNDNGGSLYVFWWLAAGSTYTSGTLGTTWHTTAANRTVGQVNFLATAGNNFFLTSVQLEVGKVATPFEYRSIGEELALCKRYYEFGYFNPTTFADQYGNATWQGFFNVEKRSTGTLSYDDGQGNTSRIARWFTSSYATNVQPTGLSADNVRGFSGYIGSLSAGTLVKVGFYWQQNSEL